ncbi:MAG: hypothetical protein H0W12_03115 [Chitinophagaceae bacterium]|nr:hypothetical protein [Chitinophagaceae bacterium]
MNKMLNKVPQITLIFWIIKILATTVGETVADFFSETLNFGLTGTSYVMGAILLVVLIIQFKCKKYIPAVFWLAVVLLSIVGTLISDNLVDNLGVSLATTSIIFGSALIVVFIAWYASEKTLSVDNINTSKKELFYWLAILFTFALGTSAGDLISESSGLGYAYAALLFAGIILLDFIAYKFLQLNAILSFWIAYILTRPLGASLGDLLSQPVKDGGLGIGTTVTSIVFLSVILILVIYLSIQKKNERTV